MAGLQHRDIVRKQRFMDFLPLMVTRVTPELLIVAVAFPIASYFGDYRAFIYLAIMAGMLQLLLSYVYAERKFLLHWDTEYVKKIFIFGWPLTLNGCLMLVTLQGDKFIISQYYSLTELGLFAIAFGLATVIPNTLGGIVSQISLPYLTKRKTDVPELKLTIIRIDHFVVILAFLISFFMLIYGEYFVELIYGQKYEGAVILVMILSVVFSIRMIRQLPNVVAVMYSDTKSVLYSNVLRQIALAIALIMAIQGAALEWIAVAGVCGELFALVSIYFMNRKNVQMPITTWLKPFSLYFAGLVCVCVLVITFPVNDNILFFVGLSLFVLITSGVKLNQYRKHFS